MSRKRKYRQLCSGITAYYEPALRYWKRTRTFFQHAAVPLQFTSDTLTTRSTEISFQQHFRPQLNHPWINPLLRRHGLHRPQYNIPTTRQGPIGITRLHRHHPRLERRHAQECLLDLHLLKTSVVLHLLHRLGSDTKEKFYTSQTLRSHSASTEFLYLLWSQHFHIDEPWRSRASAQLKMVFRFRKLMIPPTQATLRLFQLPHGFLQRCRRFFREFLQLNSQLFPPLQVPASPIIEVKTHTRERYLFTFRHFLRQWTPEASPKCVCHRIRSDFARHPDSGHVIGFASDIFPGFLLSEANLQDTVWPQERYFLNHSATQMERWLRAWNLPTRLQVEWQHFFRQEWERHQHHHSTHPTGWSHSKIQVFRRYTKDFVDGPGDHFPHTAVLTCPCHYHHLLCKTFVPSPTTSTPAFQPLRHGILLIKTRLRDLWPDIAGAFTGIADYLPLTSYQNTLVIGTRHARSCLTLRQSAPHSVRRWLPPFIVSSKSSSLTSHHSLTFFHFFVMFGDYCRVFVLYQQDIAGFFNFVTHPRMISTVEFLITRYASLQGLDLRDDPVLSVAQHHQERFRGRWRKTSRSYHHIHLRDLPDLVTHLLASSYPTAGLTVFRQCQGASMGSPLAPALCSAVALFREYCFLRSFPTFSWRYATGLALRARYVDNVFFLGPTHMLHTDSFRSIAQPFFYGRPLEMEFVPEDTLLGFILSTSQRTITFRQPPHLTLIRSNRTAGSPQMALAGFFTRGILICRLTRPRDLIFPQLIDLTQQYLDKDFTMTQLLPLLHQLCHRFHLPRQPIHSQCRFLTFSPGAATGSRFALYSFSWFPILHSYISPRSLLYSISAQTPSLSDMSRPTPSAPLRPT